jgi:hypothetical protein
MKRWILALIGVALWSSALRAAEPQLKPVEIGYIESFDHKADVYVLKTGDTRREVAILAPVFNGDTIEVNDPFATLTLRLVGQTGPIVLSKANEVATITGRIPQKGFLSGVFGWTASVVQLFDREQREQVSASIRGNIENLTGNQLSAPLFALPQAVLAGRRKLTIGWVSPPIVEIRVLDGDGRPVASGRGSGTLWATPEVDWKPGEYTIELAASGETMRQSLHFLPIDKGPNLPTELGDPTVPEPLRAAAVGTWYAAEDPAFLLEALQHVAPDAGSSRPARLLTLAFIEGKRPSPQSSGGRGEGEGHGGPRSGHDAWAPPSTR